ncbi:uncharacterized protein LOC110651994 [Hevea brasiliensis]|uniref:uncharacterized protein LOC110651994 n=1 Tax=Hevea brasiliensis TaxID=3981 RepID=UPI0025DC4145|nr:uncharacterized protein LOC110651994 [Hevea brasiliensis]
MVSGDEDVATVFNDIDKGNIGGRPKDSEDDNCCRFPDCKAENDMKDPTFQIGMLFKNKDEFKKACRAFGIKHKFQIHFPRNEVRCIEAKCYKSCGWRIYATRRNPRDTTDLTMQIKAGKFTHTCGKDFKNFHVTAKWLAQQYLDAFRADPEWSINGLINRVKNDLSFTIGKMKAWRARVWAIKTLNGDEKDQYAKLYGYKEELIRTNPGMIVEFQTEKGKFEGIYICLAALKNAFNEGLRKLICLDGCCLKGTHGGQLLSTVAIDPNDCIFPLAYAVGLIGAVSELFPNTEYRFCVKHLYTNFRGRFKGKELKDLLWNIARSAYTARMDYWLEMIRSKLMKQLFKKKEDIKKWNGGICPKIQKKLNEMKELSCLFEAHFSGEPNVQVLGAGTQYVVSLVERTCTCRRWDLNGTPCAHACSVIFGNNEHPEDYIHECYKVDTYAKVYTHYINPINGYEMWSRPSTRYSFTHPDPIEKKIGRKRKARKKEAKELEHA